MSHVSQIERPIPATAANTLEQLPVALKPHGYHTKPASGGVFEYPRSGRLR